MLRPLQRATWAASLLGVAYLLWRFESFQAPAGLAPTVGLAPEERGILDLRPQTLGAGDIVLYADTSGLRHFARLQGAAGAEDVAPERWTATGDDGRPLEVPRAAVLGRVILVWPF
ncbi:MAG: hypothetical protein R3F49_20275 [Planctomycetota bacterium]